MKVLAVALVLVASTALAQEATPPATAAPTAPAADVDIAKAHFNTGQAYYEHGRFEDAAREFEEAYRLSPKAPLLYNMGKSYDGANDFAHALDAYERFLAAAAPDNSDRDFAAKRVEMLKSLVGKIAIDGAVDGSAVTLDGKAVGNTPIASLFVVNPGRHKLEVAHERYATWRSGVDVPVGGSVNVAVNQSEAVKVVTVATAAPPPPEKPIYKKWWLWTAVGGVLVAGGVIAALVATSGSTNGTPTVQLPQVK